jgi:hypothetical protein
VARRKRAKPAAEPAWVPDVVVTVLAVDDVMAFRLCQAIAESTVLAQTGGITNVAIHYDTLTRERALESATQLLEVKVQRVTQRR